MTHPILILIAILGFCGWCLFVDADNASAGTNNFFHAMCRVVARHIKLVFRFVFAVMVALVALWGMFEIGALVSSKASGSPTGGGIQTERFSHFINEATWPVQMVLDGFTTLLGIIAALTLFFFEAFCRWYLAHARVCNLALFAFYLIWLVYTVWTIMEEVYDHCSTAIACTALALTLWSGLAAILIVNFLPVLTQIHQAVVANIYFSPY